MQHSITTAVCTSHATIAHSKVGSIALANIARSGDAAVARTVRVFALFAHEVVSTNDAAVARTVVSRSIIGTAVSSSNASISCTRVVRTSASDATISCTIVVRSPASGAFACAVALCPICIAVPALAYTFGPAAVRGIATCVCTIPARAFISGVVFVAGAIVGCVVLGRSPWYASVHPSAH